MKQELMIYIQTNISDKGDLMNMDIMEKIMAQLGID